MIGIYAYPRRGFGAGFVRDGGIPGIVRRKENFRIPCGLSCGDLLGELSCIGDLNGAEISMPFIRCVVAASRNREGCKREKKKFQSFHLCIF